MNRASNRVQAKQSKQIVHLARRYSPMIGGVEKHLENLNQELIRRGHKVVVITEQTNSDLKKFEVVGGVKIYRLPVSSEAESGAKIAPSNFLAKLKFKIKLWQSIWGIRKILRTADYIQIHDVFFWILPFWVFIFRKVHITFHGYEGNNRPKRIQVFWHRLAAKLTRNNLCIGGFHQKWFGVVPGAISFGAAKLLKRNNQIKITDSPKKLVYIGRLQADTGILIYLKGFKNIQESRNDLSDLTLDIYGDGPQRIQAEEFALKNKLNVRFYGFVADAEKLLPQYDLVFAAGYLAIIESFAAGKPVVAYYDNELKKDYLILSPFKDWLALAESPRDIANAVLDFHPDKTLNQLKVAQNWAQAQTWSKMADLYEKIWHEKS